MTHREPWRVSTKNGLDSLVIDAFVEPSDICPCDVLLTRSNRRLFEVSPSFWCSRTSRPHDDVWSQQGTLDTTA